MRSIVKKISPTGLSSKMFRGKNRPSRAPNIIPPGRYKTAVWSFENSFLFDAFILDGWQYSEGKGFYCQDEVAHDISFI